jgi:DNA-binding SARP family transcriptional activator
MSVGSHKGVTESVRRSAAAPVMLLGSELGDVRGTSVDFGVLGPFEVRDGDTVVKVANGRERLVLAVLLLNTGGPVSPENLIDALWDEPPPTAKAQLHNLVSQLRRRLRPDVIVSGPAGYAVDVLAHALDLHEFRALAARGLRAVTEGDHPRAVAVLDEALSLWRGPALADLPDSLAAGLREALRDERVEAVEARLGSLLALGSTGEVLRELPALIAANPYRESLYAKQMLALSTVGRRADALACYQRVYRRFADELGVKPGQALRDLEQRILRDEVPAPVSVPRQLPPSPDPLTGRDDLLGEILGSPNPITLLIGQGGVGKTAVALAAAHRLGPSFPGGQLYADLAAGRERPADPHAVAGRFLRALGVDGDRVPEDPDERIALYRSLLAERRVLVVLDNAESEAQLRPLLPGTAECRTLITTRHRLGALVGAARWTVPMLTAVDSLELLGRVAGTGRVAAEAEAATAIAGLCAHLPLALVVAAGRLAAYPQWTLAELRDRLSEERGRLDELRVGDLDVRATLEVGYRTVEPGPRALLRLLGLVQAQDWPAWVAETLVGGPAAHLLTDLTDAHLVQPLGRDSLGQERFRLHDLVAGFARERAGAEDEAGVRASAVARMLEGWLALAVDADTRISHALLRESSVDSLPAPPEPAEIVRENPAEWFEAERRGLAAVVYQAVRAGDARTAGRLALRLSGFLWLRSYDEDWADALRHAVSAVREAGHDELLIRLVDAQFEVAMQRHHYAELPDLADEQQETAARLGDRQLRVRALRNIGRAALRLDEIEAGIDVLTWAVVEARHPELPPGALGDCVASLGWALREAGDLAGSAALMAEAGDLDRAMGETLRYALRRYHLALALTGLGRTAEARVALTESMEITRDAGDDLGCAYVDQALADVDILDGRFADARRRIDRALDTHRILGDADGEATALRSRGSLAVAEGRFPEAVTAFRGSLDLWRRIGPKTEIDLTEALLEKTLQPAGNERNSAIRHPG